MASGSFAGPTTDVFTGCLGPTCLTAPSFCSTQPVGFIYSIPLQIRRIGRPDRVFELHGLDRKTAAPCACARQEPAEALARALDVRRRARRRADQQCRRAWPARRRHLPQALTRQPLARRRTHDRTAALGRPDLPAATPLALRLPLRRTDGQSARRPAPRPSP